MIGFTVLAVQIVLWQNQDISVDIVSEIETGTQEVKISIRNTAGSTLLFYENAEVTGKIEYLSEDGWVDFCDVSYTNGNVQAISQLYGGTFAELEPGEDWNLSVPEEKISEMKNGTYRIKMTYITEKNYNKYLETSYKNRLENSSSSSENPSKAEISDESSDISSDISTDISIDESQIFGELSTVVSDDTTESSEEVEEKFLAASQSEVFVKTFNVQIPEDFVSEISIEGRSMDFDDVSFVTKNESQTNELN